MFSRRCRTPTSRMRRKSCWSRTISIRTRQPHFTKHSRPMKPAVWSNGSSGITPQNTAAGSTWQSPNWVFFPLNVSIGGEARRLRINISETLEHRLRSIVRGQQEGRWLEENQEAIASINAFLDRDGLLASKLRYR